MFELNSMNLSKFQYHEKVRFECHEWFCIQMFLQLISIPGCDNKSWTTSVSPLDAAQISGVSLNVWVKFHESFKISIEWKS